MKEKTKLTKEITKTNFALLLVGEILNHHNTIISYLYNRAKVVDAVKSDKPDFEKLVNGTVIIYNQGYSVAGVCIDEDDKYYYILTCEHILSNKENTTSRKENAIPESNMGLATNLEAIEFFLSDNELKEPIPNHEIINITVQTKDYIMVAGEFLYVSSFLDLGLLRIYKQSNMELDIIKLAEISPKIGDDVYVLGHPLGIQYNLSRGIVSNLNRPFAIMVDALMTFGNSGGGVFNEKGELIGICSRVPVYIIEQGEISEEKDNYRYKLYPSKK
jgi:hypothetical protein